MLLATLLRPLTNVSLNQSHVEIKRRDYFFQEIYSVTDGIYILGTVFISHVCVTLHTLLWFTNTDGIYIRVDVLLPFPSARMVFRKRCSVQPNPPVEKMTLPPQDSALVCI